VNVYMYKHSGILTPFVSFSVKFLKLLHSVENLLAILFTNNQTLTGQITCGCWRICGFTSSSYDMIQFQILLEA